jgi:hypothetical protein
MAVRGKISTILTLPITTTLISRKNVLEVKNKKPLQFLIYVKTSKISLFIIGTSANNTLTKRGKYGLNYLD